MSGINSDAPDEGQVARAVLNRLIANPKTRARALTLLKETHPDLPIPEVDALAPVNDRMAALEKQNGELLKRLENREQDEAIERRFARLQRERGFTDEGIGAIKQLMVDKSLADPDAAADHYEADLARKNPPKSTEPGASWTGDSYLDTADEAVAAWFKDPDGMVDKEINAVLQEAAHSR